MEILLKMKLPRQVYLTGNAKLTGEGKYFGNYEEIYLAGTTNIF